MKKRFLCMIIVIVAMLGLAALSANAMTRSEFDAKLNSLQSQYPHDSRWYSSFDGGSQCYGYANLISYNVFGTSAKYWEKSYDLSGVKAGDVIQYGNPDNGYGHTIFVTNVSGDTITYTDCNSDWNCIVKWGSSVSKNSYISYAFSYRYVAPDLDDSYFDFWGVDDGITVSGTHKFWWKEVGYGNCDINIDLGAGNYIGTLYPDSSGYFSYSMDTTKYNDGNYTFNAIIRSTDGREKTVHRNITINNGRFFYFWAWEDNPTLTGTPKLWWKENGYGDCHVDIYVDNAFISTIYPDSGGFLSYYLNTRLFNDGTHTIKAQINGSSGLSRTEIKTININNGLFFDFWGSLIGTNNGITVSDNFKVWWKEIGFGNCNISLYIDDVFISNLNPDSGGFFSYNMDTLKYENGNHIIKAVMNSDNNISRTVTRTIKTNNTVTYADIPIRTTVTANTTTSDINLINSVEAKISNSAAKTFNPTVMFAYKYADGTIAGIHKQSISIGSNQTVTVTDTISAQNSKRIDSVEVYVWDGAKSIIPMSYKANDTFEYN